VWCREIGVGLDGDEAVPVDPRVRQVVVPPDLLEANRLGDPRSLEEVADIGAGSRRSAEAST
jgi:hypothetical protein